ncbi:MAG: hypothetical protein E5X74_15275 [Mesorhizobium sp.]|uniref:hypothetical protein n=1 Tax=Mesorhizobium sp. TaxID=1871066 RepID=UPI0011FE61E3|nr:hypothetical protein [Mesorhizobium sp.]TIO75225.1 MAG: hypothetical protein E5X75_20335 [Mesorhizobium sp.]TIO84577.1 MAG: hypothetical protein E5X74_15275 [Mesorhizobium sp.]
MRLIRHHGSGQAGSSRIIQPCQPSLRAISIIVLWAKVMAAPTLPQIAVAPSARRALFCSADMQAVSTGYGMDDGETYADRQAGEELAGQIEDDGASLAPNVCAGLPKNFGYVVKDRFHGCHLAISLSSKTRSYPGSCEFPFPRTDLAIHNARTNIVPSVR